MPLPTLPRRMALPAIALLLSPLLPGLAHAAAACPPLLQHTLPRLQDEKPVSLCGYADQVLLVVNTASYCGFTPQYEALEALAAKYKPRGLVVLGFPSNDFSQEPGSNAQIAEFCANTFGVKFPMFAKSSVAAWPGRPLNPLYAQLRQRSGKAPQWNFHKYLVGRGGEPVLSFASEVNPQDPAFVRELEKLLGAKVN